MTPRSKQLLRGFGKSFWISLLVQIFVFNLASLSATGSFFVGIFYFALWGLVYGALLTFFPDLHLNLDATSNLDLTLAFLPVCALYSLIFASVVTLAKSRNP